MKRTLAIGVPAVTTVILAARYAWLCREIQVVPEGLAEPVALLRNSGWQLAARHPLRCREPGPHVHIGSPGGYLAMTLFADGKVRIR